MLILSEVQNATLIFKPLYSPSVVFVTDQIPVGGNAFVAHWNFTYETDKHLLLCQLVYRHASSKGKLELLLCSTIEPKYPTFKIWKFPYI